MKWYLTKWFPLMLVMITIGAQAQTNSVRLITHDSFAISDELKAEFERATGYELVVIPLGDTGSLVNQAVLTTDNPLGDVLFGVDNTFLGRALDNDVFSPYASPLREMLSADFAGDETPDAEPYVTPITYGDVCLNYDIAYFEANDLPVPATLEDLTLEAYRGLLVAPSPATSSPGLAFMLATVAAYGTEGDDSFLDYWERLVDNETLIVDSWETAYFTYFSAAAVDGDYPLVVSYASSPPFTVSEDTGLPTTASIVADGMCFRQVEYAGVLANAANPAGAQAFIDFMLGEGFQTALPDLMYVFPVRADVELPELFARFAQVVAVPAEITAEAIAENRDTWIEQWVERVGR
jgi:thiamine transport system substrate-binding protein